MTKHILCAIDLTHDADARAILALAGKQAGYTGAGLSVVTVIPDYGTSFVASFFEEGTQEKAKDAANKALHKMVREVLPDRRDVQHIVEIGNAYEKVVESLKYCDADMIVVGAHKPEISDRFLGPNAARIVRNAPVSVMVIRL